MRFSRRCAVVSAAVLTAGMAAGQGGGAVQRDIRREENRQSSVATLTVRVAEELRRVKEEYQFNGVGRAEEIAVLDEVAGALERLADPNSSTKLRNMPWVVAKLAAAREAEEILKRRDVLAAASGGQGWIVDELSKLIASVRSEFGENLAGGLLREVIERQERLMEDTAKLAESTLGKPVDGLSPEERAERDRLAEQQAALKQDLNGAIQEMRDAARQLAQSEPAKGQALEQAASRLEQAQVGEQMQAAANDIRNNQMGSAQENQQRIMDALREASQASEASSSSPVTELDRQLAEMQNLIERQEALLGETQGLDQGSSQQDYNELQGKQAGIRGDLQEMMGAQSGQERAQQQQQSGQQGAQQQQQSGQQGAQQEQQSGQQGAQQQQQSGQQGAQQQQQSGQQGAQQQQAGQEGYQQQLARAGQAMSQAQQALGQQNKEQAAGAMQEALENLRAARSEMAMQLAQMQAGQQQAMQQGTEPGQQQAMQQGTQPGMPQRQQSQPNQRALETRQYQPSERRALYGAEKETQGQAGWQAELAPKEREVLATSAKEQFPEGYERLLQLYYRNLASTRAPGAGE